MTRKEEQQLAESIRRIRDETHENNIMLRQIIKYINLTIAHHNQENENDFGMNVIANIISNGLKIKF